MGIADVLMQGCCSPRTSRFDNQRDGACRQCMQMLHVVSPCRQDSKHVTMCILCASDMPWRQRPPPVRLRLGRIFPQATVGCSSANCCGCARGDRLEDRSIGSQGLGGPRAAFCAEDPPTERSFSGVAAAQALRLLTATIRSRVSISRIDQARATVTRASPRLKATR